MYGKQRFYTWNTIFKFIHGVVEIIINLCCSFYSAKAPLSHYVRASIVYFNVMGGRMVY